MKIFKIDDGVYCGPEPKCEADWQDLLELGINHILDLQTGSNWIFNDGHPLTNQLKAANCNMIGWNHPLGAILPPTKRELNDAVYIMSKYKPIYVHCKNGVDRTGMVRAMYRVRQNCWTPQEAIKEMRANGGHWRYFYWWAEFMGMFQNVL